MAFFGAIGQIWREIGEARRRRKLGMPEPEPVRVTDHRRARWLADAAQLDAVLERTGYSGVAAEIHRAARPCLYLFDAGPAVDATIGATRFGGAPDLPIGTDWPKSADGAPLLFYAQITLRDIAGTPIASELPAAGMLSFFAGDLQADTIPVRVFLSPQEAELYRCQPVDNGDPDLAPLRPVSVRFEPGLSFPTFDWDWMEKLELGNSRDNYDALTKAFWSPFPVLGQLLGHSSWSGDDLREPLHFQALGRHGQERLRIFESWGDWEQAKTKESRLRGGTIYRPWSARDDDNVRWILDHRDAISEGVSRWQSLLTIESNQPMNLSINDANAIYFFIDRDALRDGVFTDVRALTTQS